MPKQYWLLKTEPTTFSIDDLRKEKKTEWWGVRNYQARNFLRDMAPGDEVLIYHSNTAPVGVAGTGKVVGEAYADTEQFRKASPYFDPKSTPECPRWFSRDIAFVRKFPAVVPLAALKAEKALSGMLILKPGSRLSVTPLEKGHFERILRLAEKKGA